LAAAHESVWDDIARSVTSSTIAVESCLQPRDRLALKVAQVQRALESDEQWWRPLPERKPEELQWLQRTAHALTALWETVEANVKGPAVGVAVKSSSMDVASLHLKFDTYLRRRYPSRPNPAVESLIPYYGGYGKQSVRVTLVENDVLPRTLVLRRDLKFSNTSTRASDEYLMLKRAHALGLPVPRPILGEADASILDGTFLLMEEVTDAVIAGATFAKDRAQQPVVCGPEYGRDMARTLAALHSKTEIAPRSAVEQEQARQKLLAEIRQLHDEWLAMDKPAFSAGIDLGFAILLATPMPGQRPHCLVHADCGMHNCLVRDGRLVALLDWELTHEGDPAEDLAIIRTLTADDVIPWPDFVREYIAAGGNPAACDPWAVSYHAVLLFIRHAMMAARVRANYHGDVHKDPVAASVASHVVERLLQYQALTLVMVIEELGSSGFGVGDFDGVDGLEAL
jgi:aminoglycoside phosphotransferase (APT) family kinase protein